MDQVQNTREAKPQILALTGLRFFLAIWVVVFHLTSPGGPLGHAVSTAPDWLCCLVRTGYVAVGVFFVLSGFVLSYNYSLARPWSFTEMATFGIARFARVYPAYCLGLVSMA